MCGCFSKTLGRAIALALVLSAGGIHAIDAQTASLPELRTAAQRSPDDARAQFNLGLALVRAGRLSEAIKPLERAAKDPALGAEARFLLGIDYFESRKYEGAIQELSGLQGGQHAEQVLYMLEESHRRTGRQEDAKADFHQLITRYPDSGWTHFLLATAYEDQQELDKAMEEYQQAYRQDASIPNAAFAIGYLYWRRQDVENARQWLEREASHGCHGLANYYLGELAREEKDYAQAERLYRRSLECDPADADAHARLGVVLGDQKRFDQAIPQLKAAIKLNPKDSSAHYRLAVIYRQQGQREKAEAEYKIVREMQAEANKNLGTMGDAQH